MSAKPAIAGQPVYALLRKVSSATLTSSHYYDPIPIMGQTDAEALDAAKDRIRSDSTYVLVRMVGDFESGAHTKEYKA